MSQDLRVAFAQTNPKFGEKKQNVEDAVGLISCCKADLIVLPELFNTGYAFLNRQEASKLAENIPEGYASRALMDVSAQSKSTVVAGLVERAQSGLYNSAAVFSKGRHIGTYRKTHLFYKEKFWFNRGNTGFKVFKIDKYKLGVMICFDWIYPESARSLALQGADVIAHPSNLVLPGLCQKVMLARSLENRVFTVTANRTGREERGGDSFVYTGMSQIVSPAMKVLQNAGKAEVTVKTARIDVADARNKCLTRLNHLFRDRSPESYDI